MKSAPRHQTGGTALPIRLLSFVVVGGVIVIPLIVSPGMNDSFRIPKELALRLEVFLALGLAAIESVRRFNVGWLFRTDRQASWFVVAILCWSGLTTLSSVNRAISAAAFLRITGLCLLFLVTVAIGRFLPTAVIGLILIPAVVNGGLLLLQETGVWNPFITRELIESLFGPGPHDVAIEAQRFSTALLGNTNDAGGYLSLCAVAAGALIGMRRFQLPILLGFGFLSFSVILSRSLSAIAALIGGLVALGFLKSRRWVLTALIALPLVVLGASTFSRPLNNRLRQARAAVRTGNYDALLSNRLVPFITALSMARDHPWSGVGPGCFTYEYLPYRLQVEALQPSLIGSGEVGVMFGEVHNDYLQVLAESGIPALAIFFAALFALARRSFQRTEAREKNRVESELVGRQLSLPLAITFAILAIGHFPLEVAAEAQLLSFLAGLSIAWTSHENS